MNDDLKIGLESFRFAWDATTSGNAGPGQEFLIDKGLQNEREINCPVPYVSPPDFRLQSLLLGVANSTHIIVLYFKD